MLESCAALLRDVDGALFTSHVNENTAEVETVRGLFPECDSYVDTYGRYGLLGRRSVLAHNVHPGDAELDQLAAAGASVAHCPSSNSALGSGLFPLRRHVERGVRWRWAPMLVQAPASRCCARACSPTSCRPSSAPTGCR